MNIFKVHLYVKNICIDLCRDRRLKGPLNWICTRPVVMTDRLPDDLLVSLVAASALVVALSSCLRRRRRPELDQQRKKMGQWD